MILHCQKSYLYHCAKTSTVSRYHLEQIIALGCPRTVDVLSSGSTACIFPFLLLSQQYKLTIYFSFKTFIFTVREKRFVCQRPNSIVQIYLYVLVIIFILYLRDSNSTNKSYFLHYANKLTTVEINHFSHDRIIFSESRLLVLITKVPIRQRWSSPTKLCQVVASTSWKPQLTSTGKTRKTNKQRKIQCAVGLVSCVQTPNSTTLGHVQGIAHMHVVASEPCCWFYLGCFSSMAQYKYSPDPEGTRQHCICR